MQMRKIRNVYHKLGDDNDIVPLMRIVIKVAEKLFNSLLMIDNEIKIQCVFYCRFCCDLSIRWIQFQIFFVQRELTATPNRQSKISCSLFQSFYALTFHNFSSELLFTLNWESTDWKILNQILSLKNSLK